MNTESIVKTK